jgi:hypothetical protein
MIILDPSNGMSILLQKGENMKPMALTASSLLLAFSLMAKAAEQDTTFVQVAEKVSEIKGQVEGMNESMLEMKTTVDALKKIKVSGYIQAQFQKTEFRGAKTSYSGGDFPALAEQRFKVRRGRVKFNYDNDLTQYVMQLDITEKGVGFKDVYFSFKEPWMKTFGVTAGVFDRPFGFEIMYSSSSRETPERSRLFQTLFPGERDLGVKLEITPQKGLLGYFNFKGGLFSGNGIAEETDNYNDFIGRLGFQLPLTSANLAIDGGVSTYLGKVRRGDGKTTFKVNSPATFETDGTTKNVDRRYFGGDLQLYYDLPVIGGFSLRGEYITGRQPGASSSSGFYKEYTKDVYLRNFTGYYACYVQNIGSKNQFVAKYDVYDPNKDVLGGDIGLANSKLTAVDLSYNTLGLGWIYHWDGNVKLVAFYEMMENETVAAGTTSKDLVPFKEDLKDDVFTFRIQYKF